MINAFDFEGAREMLPRALAAAQAIGRLKRRARQAGVPVVYVNDNFGRWRSDFSVQVRHVREDGTRGGPIAELLAPGECDYFVLKPKHSAFYQTCLGILLEHLGVKTLLIGGFATDSCVQLTAGDAFLRGFNLLVLQDGSATQGGDAHENSLEQMKRVLSARIVRCEQVRFTEQENGARVQVLD